MRAFYWTDERATLAYDLWVIAILAFVWLTPPDWLGDPMAIGGQGCFSGCAGSWKLKPESESLALLADAA